MKYPPFSWLRLGDEIRKPQSRMWFTFDKLPSSQGDCTVKIHIGGPNNSITDPYDALLHNILLRRQRKVLEILLKIAKPAKNRGEYILNNNAFSRILPYCAAVPFEISGLGVISFAKVNASIKAQLMKNEKGQSEILFVLVKGADEPIENPRFFGDINAYVIDQSGKLYTLVPYITPEEAISILGSPPLLLLGLCQEESREMFYTLSRLGIDFSCLIPDASKPESSQIVLRLMLSIDDITKHMCARVHLVTHLTLDDFSDEVEIKSTGTIPNLHIAAMSDLNEEKFVDDIAMPKLIQRPFENEQNARNFLYHLGAGPARMHDGFELAQEEALELLKTLAQKEMLPPYIKLDEHARPNIIELTDKPILVFKEVEERPNRVEVALSLSPEFDRSGAAFRDLLKAKDQILVVDEDTMVISNPDFLSRLNYLVQAFSVEKPNQFKSKSIAQVALLINAIGDQIELKGQQHLLDYLKNFSIAPKDEDHILPTGLKTTLRPYQHDAVAWLSSLYRSGLGGLLGDEMGLGKTLMVLTHLAKLLENHKIQAPALVVCPTSVMDVWQSEAKIHIPTLRVMKWHGPERAQMLDQIKDCDILITSYAILRRDAEGLLSTVKFSTLVLDEAQFVRNQQTDSFKSTKAINCLHRIALTGTPIENHIGDLYNILDCVEEGILGPKAQFEKQFSPGSVGEEPMHSNMNLKMLIAPIVTRRKKADVEAELPPKIENIVYCALSTDQKALYRQFVGQLSGTFKKQMMESSNPNHQHFTMLSALTRLRQICCHPSLILGKSANEQESGKISVLREIMGECLEMGRKIIIYSQFLKMQELIVNLAAELDPAGALWLHGSTKNRDEVVKSFQDGLGPKMIVVSLKAGGTGITLTQADTVIFADPWWNPAVEDQAIDRAHRIGQKKTVHVIRLIAKNTIEDEVVALAQRKRQTANAILQDGFSNASNLTRDEVKALLLNELSRLKPADQVMDEFDL